MSGASDTSRHTRRLSKASGADGNQHQSTDSDEQPSPENHIVGPTGGEKEMSGPSTVKLLSWSSNAPSQSSKPHQDGTFNDSPNDLPPEAAGVVVQQSDLTDLKNTMNKVLDVLQDSTIASKGGKDVRSRFWTVYQRVSEEHDSEFLERYSSDMDIVLVFSGLFSAVSTTFIVAMEPSLSPDPSDTTNALLTQLVQIGLGNLSAAGVEPAAPASAWSPPMSNVRIQAIAYASLCMSLLAAFGAVLGKQWLGYYKASRYGRGSPEERGKRRHEKFDGIITWYFDAVLQSFPVLLQLSLLLFGIALSANMWYQPHSIAWVIIATTVFGFLFYSLTLMAALVSPACPFQTPISTILRMWHVDRVLRSMVKLASRARVKLAPTVKLALRYFQQLKEWVEFDLWYMLDIELPETSWREVLADAVRAVRSFASHCLQALSSTFHLFVPWLRSSVVYSPAQVGDSEAQVEDSGAPVEDSEAQSRDWNLDYHRFVYLPHKHTSGHEAPSIKWLLETSTDPEVFFAAASLVPQVEWPLDLDVSETLHALYDIYESCVDVQSRIVPSLEEKASVCTMALSHLYCGRALQVYVDDDSLRNEITGSWHRDFELFYQMNERCKAQDRVLALTARLSRKYPWDSTPERHLHPIEFSDPALEWLSHILPYHFVAGRVDEDVEKLATAVISKLLSSPSLLSTQILANCTLLACVMIGVQFDAKHIVRIDKSSALPQLAKALWKQFETTLWSDLDGESIGARRQEWNLTDVIFRILQLGLPPSSLKMRQMDLSRKIYSWAWSSEQNLLTALRRVQHFRCLRLAYWEIEDDEDDIDSDSNTEIPEIPKIPKNPDWVWFYCVPLKRNLYSPEDFDWLVDYLDAVDSNDHDTACDILVLISSMSVSCSPAKQHLFIDRLIACMDSSMPVRLRHLALRAAHSFREVLISIDAIDDADTLLTRLSPAIMSTICPRPGATHVDDDPDGFFNRWRDFCYLKLVFALAKNSIWHPHLVGDHHIDRCIGMIAEYCQSSTILHPCYLVGILLRVAPEQVSVTSRGSLTDEQCWDIIRRAWMKIYSFLGVKGKDADELLPVLVEVTKKYMQIASKSDLEQLIKHVDRVIREVEQRGLVYVIREVEQRGLECIDDVKELGTVARDRLLQRFGSIVICRQTFN